MKIIGYTVGTTLPKPNLAQNDPKKGDYVKNREALDDRYYTEEEINIKLDALANASTIAHSDIREEIGKINSTLEENKHVVITLSSDERTASMTATEIKDAMDNGFAPVVAYKGAFLRLAAFDDSVGAIFADVIDSYGVIDSDNKIHIVTIIIDSGGIVWSLKTNNLSTLSDVETEITKHNTADDSHSDIREAIKTNASAIEGLATTDYVDGKISAIPTPDVSGQINTHNTATDAHSDIRGEIAQKAQVQIITWGADD